MEEEDTQLVLDRNPLEWSVDEVVQFINSTDCASLANIFQEQVSENTSSRHNYRQKDKTRMMACFIAC